MSGRRDWSVLVVDDQVNVVNGVICGIRWDEIDVKNVYKAYDAMEAKTILLQNHVDILLCDIEMPGENGLQLYKWICDRGMEVECIFLTSHADFLYARTAIKLGSFDYILQPARYEDVESAVVRAKNKITKAHEQKRFYSYGKTVFQDRNRIMDSLFQAWYREPEDTDKGESVQKSMVKMDIAMSGETKVCPVLLEVLEWKDGIWDKELFRISCTNILEEMLGDGCRVWLSWLEQEFWCALVWKENGILTEEQIQSASRDFFEMGLGFFRCNMALYIGENCRFADTGKLWQRLKGERENNVALKCRIFFGKDKKENCAEITPVDYHAWERLLERGLGRTVYEQACSWLDAMAEYDCLDAYVLQRFYNEFVRILVVVAERSGTSQEDIFSDKKQVECYLGAYANITVMKEFLRMVTAFFTQEEEDENKADVCVEQIKDYIYRNLDQEIRREDIAMEVFMNPSYVSRMFKKKTGISMKEFIIQEKMKMAQALLKSSALPVSIVALKVGYSNFSHFSQLYKKTFGIRPTEERK
ncbi:MAG: response regulator [Lachnospiraceae bacterium]|nr:response regulator [Lachnospiraceae bacterium]